MIRPNRLGVVALSIAGCATAAPNRGGPPVEVIDRTIFQHTEDVRGAARASVRFEATDVNVEDVIYSKWTLLVNIDAAAGTYRVEELGDERAVTETTFRVAADCRADEPCLPPGEHVRFRLLFFGEPGFMVSPTGRMGDTRLVEPNGETTTVSITIAAEADAPARLDIGTSGMRARAWSGLYDLTGRSATIEERITMAQNGATYLERVVSQDEDELRQFAAKVWALKADISGGRPIHLAPDNVLRSGPGLLVQILLDLFFSADLEAAAKVAAYVRDDVDELIRAQRLFTRSPSPDKNRALDEMYREIVGFKITKLFYCTFVSKYQTRVTDGMTKAQLDFLRLTGLPFVRINGDAFEECVDAVEQMRWALTAAPTNCDWVRAHPHFDVSQCNPDSPNTYANTHVMRYLCLSYNQMSNVTAKDSSDGATSFVRWMKRHDFEKLLLPRIWKKIVNYCRL